MLFGVAAAWNLIGGAVLVFNPELHLERFAVRDTAAIWLVRSLASSATSWGIAYLLIAIDSRRFRSLIWLGAVSKLLFAAILIWGWLAGEIKDSAAFPGAVDLLFGILFLERAMKMRERKQDAR